MDLYNYESRLQRPVKVKIPDFQTGERLDHIVFSDQFSKSTLDRLGRSADRIRLLAKSKEGYCFLSELLRHKRVMLYFTQPSTRTFLSFMAACQIPRADLLGSSRSRDLIRDKGRIAVRFHADVQQLLRFGHHAKQGAPVRRVLCLHDE